MKQEIKTPVPVTAELLSEMDAIEVIGGTVEIPVTVQEQAAESAVHDCCTRNYNCNTYC